ncbi:winged helix-turn-helix transcriptional regulator [Nocardioides sambongensis]|uniref:winged helix-turn-helix transcriptional regulator n=1 Tax=Nocardioides sambongensis TaxID=2589074 RepID=UPI00112EBA28|nr:winged helix-turn-helix domain-containing protein [Nocardioides sambongensis]
MLVVDPDREPDDLRDGLAGRGVHLTWVNSTTDGLIAFGRTDPHAVVVAPEAAGIPADEFVTTIRRHGSPYVIAALGEISDAAVGSLMVAGASAWVPRPFSVGELWGQLSSSPHSIEEHARIAVGPLELDAAAYRVTVGAERLPDLPLKEFELLRALMLRAPGVVSDDELRAALWGTRDGSPSGNTIAMHVTRLRARIGGVAEVRRIRGRGYALTVEVD